MLENVLRQLHSSGKTVILANHDIGQSLRLAERAVVLKAGRKVIDGPTRELDERRVLGEMSP
jgi:ABC-type cobalamin transport system ATPase subunit